MDVTHQALTAENGAEMSPDMDLVAFSDRFHRINVRPLLEQAFNGGLHELNSSVAMILDSGVNVFHEEDERLVWRSRK
jgi:hypothetical protein